MPIERPRQIQKTDLKIIQQDLMIFPKWMTKQNLRSHKLIFKIKNGIRAGNWGEYSTYQNKRNC
jgi:hypothetical protein